MDLSAFVGTWKNVAEPPLSAHTLTWQIRDDQLLGRWIVEGTVDANTSFEVPVSDPWVENGVVFFHIPSSQWPSEFRLVGDGEALLGGARDKMPADLAEIFRQSIDSHRMRFFRQPPTST